MMSDALEATGGVSISLGKHWIAIVFPDGSLLLQNRSCVVDINGSLIDLNDPKGIEALEQLPDPTQIVTRAISLHPDGTVKVDPHGISKQGVLGASQFVLLESIVSSLRKQGMFFLEEIFSEN